MTKFGSLAAIGAVVLAATLATRRLASNAQQPVPLVVDNNVIPSASVPLNEWVSNPCVTPTYYYPASLLPLRSRVLLPPQCTRIGSCAPDFAVLQPVLHDAVLLPDGGPHRSGMWRLVLPLIGLSLSSQSP